MAGEGIHVLESFKVKQAKVDGHWQAPIREGQDEWLM